ncbi:MAG: hypothetical protein AAF653_19635, partial [Chloroflexota bacterium]
GNTTGDFTITFDIEGQTTGSFTPPGEKEPAPATPNATADCDSTFVSSLVDAAWEIDTDELQMQFTFACDGSVVVNVNGQDIGTATYTVEDQPDDTLTLTIDTGTDTIDFTRVVVTPTTVSALLNDETFIAMTATG